MCGTTIEIIAVAIRNHSPGNRGVNLVRLGAELAREIGHRNMTERQLRELAQIRLQRTFGIQTLIEGDDQ